MVICRICTTLALSAQRMSCFPYKDELYDRLHYKWTPTWIASTFNISLYSFCTIPCHQNLECYFRLNLTLFELIHFSILIVDNINIDVPCEFESTDNPCFWTNFRQIQLNLNAFSTSRNRKLSSDADHFLSKIVSVSPKLDTLSIINGNSYLISLRRQYFQELLDTQRRHMTHFECGSDVQFDESNHTTFYYELSEICPMLTMITHPCTSTFIAEYPTAVTKFIDDLRCYFTKLTRVSIRMHIEVRAHSHIFDSYKKYLEDEIAPQKDKYYYKVVYGDRDTPEMPDYLNIWLWSIVVKFSES